MNEHSQEDVRARLFLQQYLSYTAVSLGVAYTPFQSLSPQLTTPCRVLPDFEPSGLASLPIWDLVSRKKRIAFPAIKPHLFHTRTIEQAVKQIVIRQVNGAPIAEGQASLLTLFIPTLETAIAPFIEDSHSDSGWQSIAIRTQVIAINFLLKPINGRSRFLRGKSKPDPTSKTQAHQVISDLYTRLSSILTLIASEKIFLSPTFPAAIPALQQLSQTVMTLSFYATQLDALSTQLTGTTPRPTTDLAALKTWRAIYGAIKIDANMDKERVKHLVTVQKHCRQVIEALKRHDHQQHLTCLLTLSQVPSTKSIQGKLNRFVMQQLRTGPWEDAAELIADMLATAIEEAYTLIQTQLRSQTKIPKQLRQLDHHYRDTRVLLALLLIALDNQQRLLPARFLHSFLSRRSEHSYTVVVLQFFATCLDEPVFHALLEDSMSLGTDSERDAMIHTLNLAANPYDEDSTIVNTTGPEEPNTWWNSPQACHAWHARFKRLMIAMPTAWWAQTLPYFSTESLLNSALLDSMLTSYTTISKEQDILNATILSLSQTADGTSRYAFLSQEKLRIFAILFHTHQLHHDCLQPYLLERDLFTKTLKAKLDLIQARYDQPQLLFPKAWFAYQIRHCIAFLFEALQTQPGYFLQSALTSNLVRQLANIVSIGLESGATESLHSLYILDLVCDTDTFQQHVHEVLLNKSDTQLHTAYTNYIAKYPPIGTSLSGACLAADFTLTLLHRFQGAFSEPVLGRAGFGLRVAILNFFSEQKTTLTKHLPESLRHDFLSCLSLVSKKNTGTSLSKLSAFSTQVSAPHLNQDTQALGEFLYYLLQLCHTPSEATLPAPILPLLLKRGFSTPLFQHIHPRLTHAVLHPTPHWDSLASLLHYVEQLSTDLPQADMHAFLTNLLPELLSAQTHSEHAQTISTVLHQLLKLVLTYLNNTDNDTSRLDILRKTATLTTHSLKKGIMTPDTPHIEELTALLQPIEAAHPLVSFLENNALAFEAVDAILDGKPITVTHERAIQHLLLNHDRLSTLASLSPKRYLQLLAGLLLFAQSPSTQHGQLNPESVALIFKTRFPETLEPKATLSQFLQLYLKPILSYSDYQVLMTLFYDNFSAPQQRDLLDMIHTDRPCFSRFFLQECDTFASPVEQWTRRHHTLTDHIDALTTTLEKTDDPALFDAIEHAVQLRSQLGCLETEASAAIVRQGRKLYDAVRTNQDVDQALLPLRTCLSPILSQEIPTSSSLHALFAISRDLHRYCERQRAISADKEAAGRAMWDGLNETMQDCLKATLYVIVFFPIPTCDTQLNSFFLLLEERAPDSEKILQDIFESPQFGHDEKRAFLLLMTRLDRLHRERLIVWLAHHMGGIASLSDDVLLSLCEHLYFANLSAKAIVALCDSVERVQELIPLLFSRNESLALLFAHALPDTEKQSLRLLTLLDGSKSLLSPDFQQFFTALAGPLDKEAPSLLDSETTASETSFRVKWALVACLQRTHSTKQHTTLITFFESLNDQRRYHTYATLFYTLFPRSFIRFLNMCPETLSQALISALLEFENQSPALIASLLAGSKQARSLALAHLTQHPLTFSNQPDLALLPILDLYVSQATTATIPSSHVESLIQYWQEHGQLEKLKQLTAHALETYFLKAAWPLSPNDLGLLSALSTPLLHAVMHKLAQDRPIKELVEHVLAAPSFLRFSPKRKAAQTRLIQDFLLKTTDPVTAATYFPQHQFLFYVAQTVLLTCPKPLPLKHLLDLLNDLRTVPCHWHPAQQEVLLSAFKTESGQKQLRSFSEQNPNGFLALACLPWLVTKITFRIGKHLRYQLNRAKGHCFSAVPVSELRKGSVTPEAAEQLVYTLDRHARRWDSPLWQDLISGWETGDNALRQLTQILPDTTRSVFFSTLFQILDHFHQHIGPVNRIDRYIDHFLFSLSYPLLDRQRSLSLFSKKLASILVEPVEVVIPLIQTHALSDTEKTNLLITLSDARSRTLFSQLIPLLYKTPYFLAIWQHGMRHIPAPVLLTKILHTNAALEPFLVTITKTALTTFTASFLDLFQFNNPACLFYFSRVLSQAYDMVSRPVLKDYLVPALRTKNHSFLTVFAQFIQDRAQQDDPIISDLIALLLDPNTLTSQDCQILLRQLLQHASAFFFIQSETDSFSIIHHLSTLPPQDNVVSVLESIFHLINAEASFKSQLCRAIKHFSFDQVNAILYSPTLSSSTRTSIIMALFRNNESSISARNDWQHECAKAFLDAILYFNATKPSHLNTRLTTELLYACLAAEWDLFMAVLSDHPSAATRYHIHLLRLKEAKKRIRAQVNLPSYDSEEDLFQSLLALTYTGISCLEIQTVLISLETDHPDLNTRFINYMLSLGSSLAPRHHAKVAFLPLILPGLEVGRIGTSFMNKFNASRELIAHLAQHGLIDGYGRLLCASKSDCLKKLDHDDFSHYFSDQLRHDTVFLPDPTRQLEKIEKLKSLLAEQLVSYSNCQHLDTMTFELSMGRLIGHKSPQENKNDQAALQDIVDHLQAIEAHIITYDITGLLSIDYQEVISYLFFKELLTPPIHLRASMPSRHVLLTQYIDDLPLQLQGSDLNHAQHQQDKSLCTRLQDQPLSFSDLPLTWVSYDENESRLLNQSLKKILVSKKSVIKTCLMIQRDLYALRNAKRSEWVEAFVSLFDSVATYKWTLIGHALKQGSREDQSTLRHTITNTLSETFQYTLPSFTITDVQAAAKALKHTHPTLQKKPISQLSFTF